MKKREIPDTIPLEMNRTQDAWAIFWDWALKELEPRSKEAVDEER